MPRKGKNESFKKKSEALKSVRLDARIIGGPLRVDWICAPSGARCFFEICRLFNYHRLSQLKPGIKKPKKIVRNKQDARHLMNDHVKKEDHLRCKHRIFGNTFYQVANSYTYNGRTTRYVLVQFHQGGHPCLGETRNHFHIRPAWIENGEFQYDDNATPDLYNFTPAEHYFYEEDDMNDYWFDEETEGCNDKKPDRRDDRGNPPGGSGLGGNKCNCMLTTAAGAATKYVVKKTAVKEATKQIAKTGGKSFAKKIPVMGAFVGLGFGAVRCFQGDFKGAVGEVASGAASCVPVVGTLASVAIDVSLVARDMSTAGDLVCTNCGKIK